MSKIITALFVFVLLSGCAQQPSKVNITTEQQTFLVKCPVSLPYDYGLEGKWWLLMAKEWSAIYHECATRHNGHIDFTLNN